MKIVVATVVVVCFYIPLQRIMLDRDNPVGPGFTMSKVFNVRPLLKNNKFQRGLALDGQLKHEDTNLASSTL